MKLKKVLIIMLLFIYSLCIICNKNVVYAKVEEGDKVTLKADHKCNEVIEFWMENYKVWSYKVVWYVNYVDEKTGEKYPAFCVEPDKNGVGITYDKYDATLTKDYDACIYRILSKGYMGSNYKDWELECDDDFYTATKTAIHSYIQKIAPKDKYIPGNFSVDGNSVEDISRRGTKVIEVAQKLYEYGLNGKDEYVSPKVNATKINEPKKEKIQDKYYITQEYSVKGNKNLQSYEVEIKDFNMEAKILDKNNIEKNVFKNESFKIAIPEKSLNKDVEGKILIKNAKILTYPVYYCTSSINGAQNYVTYTSSYETCNTLIDLKISAKKSNLELIKIDSITKEALEGVTFEITKENGDKIGEYVTNDKGKILINNLYPGIIKVKEIKVPNNYKINDKVQKVELKWGETSKIEIENTKIKGKISILKVDEKDKEKHLPNVEFELYNNKNEIVDHLITDENGKATSKELDIGKYILKEVKTIDGYEINEKEYEINIETEKTIELTIENKPIVPEKPATPEKPKLPKTGF